MFVCCACVKVASFPFEDHSCPPFELIAQFCVDMHKWLSLDPRNVVACHCKAGKGRTGMLIACYLVFSKTCANSLEALNKFAKERTVNQRGVSIPSQKRLTQANK